MSLFPPSLQECQGRHNEGKDLTRDMVESLLYRAKGMPDMREAKPCLIIGMVIGTFVGGALGALIATVAYQVAK